jgi:sugar lactone lactonase YvrE
LRSPVGIAASGGVLFVGDFGNHQLRKLTIATAQVDAFIGGLGYADSPAAPLFRSQMGMVSDGTHLYVADHGNHVIRKVEIATGTTTTLAGVGGVAGSNDTNVPPATEEHLNLPTDVALLAGNLYVADYGNHTIRKIDAAGTTTTLAGAAGVAGAADKTGTQASFNRPVALVAAGGNLYVADNANYTIRKVTPGGAVTTFAGTAPNSGFTNGTAAAAQFNVPIALRADAQGNLYVADNANGVIRKIEAGTGNVTTFAGPFNSPNSLAIEGTTLYVGDLTRVRAVDLASGAITPLAGGDTAGSADGIGADARFNSVKGLAPDGKGNLWVADHGSHGIRCIALATGHVRTLFGQLGVAGHTDGIGGEARFTTPTDVAHHAGRLYVTGNHVVRAVDLASGAVTTLAGAADQPGHADGIGSEARLSGTTGIATDATGNLWIVDGNQVVKRIEPASGRVTTRFGLPGRAGYRVGPAPGALNSPRRPAFLPSGELAVASAGDHAVLLLR